MNVLFLFFCKIRCKTISFIKFCRYVRRNSSIKFIKKYFIILWFLKYTEILSIFLCYSFSTKDQSLFIFSAEYFSLFFIRLKRISNFHLGIILCIIKSFYILFIYFCLYHFLITTIPILNNIFNYWKIAILWW